MPDNRFPELNPWRRDEEYERKLHEQVVAEREARLPHDPYVQMIGKLKRPMGPQTPHKGPYSDMRDRVMEILSSAPAAPVPVRSPVVPPTPASLYPESQSKARPVSERVKKALNLSGALRDLSRIDELPGATRPEKFQYAMRDYRWVPLLIATVVIIVVLFVLRYAA